MATEVRIIYQWVLRLDSRVSKTMSQNRQNQSKTEKLPR